MKTTIFDSKGSKQSQINLPKIFETPVRADLIQKYFEADKFTQPYAPDTKAGKKHSASGTISHKRHDWKGHYGRGISRIPRKTMWRRGTQFFWIGAEVSSTRGGRRAHPPKGVGKEKKINKKEINLAISSAFAATANKDYVLSRYSSLDKLDSAPGVIDSMPAKTKDAVSTLKKIFGSAFSLVLKKKSVRAGRGKTRGRKYKSNAGLLVIVGSDEKSKFSGLDIKPLSEVTISDLYPLGRLTLYTKKAIEELGGKKK